MIKVSIITVCYNSEKTISKTISSVLNQTYTYIEYVIIDNCSTDTTISIVNSYLPKFTDNKSLRLISEPDKGIYDAMNKGIKRSRGELIGIINSDDWYEPTAVEIAVNAQKENSESVIYGMLKIYKNNMLYQIRQNTHYFIAENMFQHPTWFVPRTIYDQHGLYDDTYKIGADYELANRLLSKGVEFIRIEKVMAHFSLGGASSRLAIGGVEWLEIREKYGHLKTKHFSLFKVKIKKLKYTINEIFRAAKKFFQ